MRRRPRSNSTMIGSSGASSVTIRMPGSDVFPFDEFHARRALVGGTLARGWFAFTHGGTNYVRSFSQGPTAVLTSRADPTVRHPAPGCSMTAAWSWSTSAGPSSSTSGRRASASRPPSSPSPTSRSPRRDLLAPPPVVGAAADARDPRDRGAVPARVAWWPRMNVRGR